jgi:hypothetical protein
MALVQPTKERATLTEDSLALMATIPARRNWFLILFLGFWLCGWLAGEIMVPLTFFENDTQAPERLFTIAWLAMWTIGGIAAIYAFAWNVAGLEVVSLTQSRLSIRKQVLGLGRLREYGLEHIANMRIAPVPFNPMDPRSALQFWGVGGGPIAFDHGASTVRFGAGLDEAEAGRLVAKFKERARKSGHSVV